MTIPTAGIRQNNRPQQLSRTSLAVKSEWWQWTRSQFYDDLGRGEFRGCITPISAEIKYWLAIPGFVGINIFEGIRRGKVGLLSRVGGGLRIPPWPAVCLQWLMATPIPIIQKTDSVNSLGVCFQIDTSATRRGSAEVKTYNVRIYWYKYRVFQINKCYLRMKILQYKGNFYRLIQKPSWCKIFHIGFFVICKKS